MHGVQVQLSKNESDSYKNANEMWRGLTEKKGLSRRGSGGERK